MKQAITFCDNENIIVAGVDEAGRGPLCGPVVAAAVVLDPEKRIVDLNDSKKLSEKKREYLAQKIKDNSLAFSIAQATVTEIDNINILQATLLAMRRAVLGLSVTPELVLVDGNQSPGLSMPVQTVIKGDSQVDAIAAASILAKVARDALMREMDQRWPQYGFSKHKGYGTKGHIEALNKYGVLHIHRRSFKPVAQLSQETER